MADIRQSADGYDDWLRRQLGPELVENDLALKREKMRESPFAFLRATYWRWAETILEICPDAASAPQVLAVGDIHLENFGTWRDADGRLVWGVNDFDEAAEMPYALDLIRLATSALMAGKGTGTEARAICSAILRGYSAGLRVPGAIVLERDQQWLREQVVVSEKKRAKFWKQIKKARKERAPAPYRKALAAAMPQANLGMKIARRTAGVGSLGRPRWIGVADWQGAPVVREAKAVLVSSWSRVHGQSKGKICCGDIAKGRYRPIDPWYRVEDAIVVRRLSPNNRKIEADDDVDTLLSPQMLQLMGLELANVHLGAADRSTAILRDLSRRKRGWLTGLAEKMATQVEAEFNEWASAADRSATGGSKDSKRVASSLRR